LELIEQSGRGLRELSSTQLKKPITVKLRSSKNW
jgi:hypothetical protein